MLRNFLNEEKYEYILKTQKNRKNMDLEKPRSKKGKYKLII